MDGGSAKNAGAVFGQAGIQVFWLFVIRAKAPTESLLCAPNDRVFDLQPVVKRNYYHPQMHGHWSIKDVLPCLVPELSYTALGSVQDGTQAQAVYLKIISHEGTETERAQWREDLRRYCELDTLAMVRVAGRLEAARVP